MKAQSISQGLRRDIKNLLKKFVSKEEYGSSNARDAISHASCPPINGHAKLSFSQEGEDMLLDRFLLNKDVGFYVDVGAHHPERFSNTYYYYQKGWRGVNIDADPDLIVDFHDSRPRDINVVAAIGNNKKSLKFYVFNERAINTFSKKIANERALIKGYEIVEERIIKVNTLSKILDTYIPKKQVIDFMSVDVEGKDLEVLVTNNWTRYRPRFLLVECLKSPFLDTIRKNATVVFLKQVGYRPVAKTLNTVIFANTDSYGK